MQLDPPLEKAILLKRYSRFLADVRMADGSVITVHCPNTGSMKNCLLPGSDCWLSKSNNSKRKYAYTWEIATTPGAARACINTARANQLVREALTKGLIKELAEYQRIQAEVKYGSEGSRIDFVLDRHPRKSESCYVEVKSVTYGEENGRGLFPDAVSIRASKHLRELIEVAKTGARAVLLYCVQHTGIEWVEPADEVDPNYGKTLREAISTGVEVIAYRARLSAEEMVLEEAVEVRT